MIAEIINKYSSALFKTDFSDKLGMFVYFQVLYRMFALNNPDWLILHGSATIAENGKAIVFGDNGNNLGKTTCAFNTAQKTKKWISDEFVLYNKKNKCIYGNSHIPIFIKKNKKLLFPKDYGFKTIKKTKLDMIVCPINQKIKAFKQTTNKKANLIRKATAWAHIIKLLNPDLDRNSITQGFKNEKKDITKILKDYPLELKHVPVYELLY